MKEQKKRSRDARKNAGADAWISDTTDLSDVANTEFVGYTDLKSTSKVLAIVKDGVRVDSIGEGEDAIIVLDKLRSTEKAAVRLATQVLWSLAVFQLMLTTQQRIRQAQFTFTLVQ